MFLSVGAIFSQTSSRWRLLLPAPTFDVAINPLNPNTIIVGGEDGWVYRSYDAGNTWDSTKIFWALNSAMLNNLIILPQDTNVLLLGGLKFCNIARSTDQGRTWDVVLSSNYCIDLNGKAMLLKPDDPNVVYLGDFMWGKIWRSTDAGLTWEHISTVKHYYKYPDSTGWKDSLTNTKICSIGLRDDSTNIILVGSILGEIFLSTDGGLTWELKDYLMKPDSLQFDCEITRIEFSPRDSRVGYAVITYLFPLNRNNGGLHITTDGGYSWDLLAFRDTSIWALAVADRGTHDEIFIGGYTEDIGTIDTFRVPGAGIIRISTDGGGSWLNFDDKIDWVITDRRQNSALYFCEYASSDTLFAGGDNGIVLRSIDGGKSWSLVFLDDWVKLNGASFINGKFGYLCSDNGTLYYTTNSGFAWNQLSLPTNLNFNAISFFSNGNGAVVGDAGVVFLTSDFGQTWKQANIPGNYKLTGVKFIDAERIIVWGSDGIILISNNFGITWQSVNVATGDITSLEFTDEDKFIFTTSDGFVMLGNLQLETPQILFSDLNAFFIGAVKINDSTIVVAKDKGNLLLTRNNGKTWQEIKYITARKFNRLLLTPDNILLMVGYYGTIIRSTDEGLNWNIVYGGTGPRANVWRAYYFNQNGQERLYMATEAGLFVLDYPLSVPPKIDDKSDNLLAYPLPGNRSIFVNYKSYESSSYKVKFNLYNSIGKLLYSFEFPIVGSEIKQKLDLPFELSKGWYLIQAVEGNKISNVMIVNY